MENNHWVTTVTVTVVHPKHDSPASVEAAVSNRLDLPWGVGVARSSSVGTFIPTDSRAVDDGSDVPDWHAELAGGLT